MLKVAKLGIAIAAVLAMIVPAAFAGVPDVTQSFYVPQTGSLTTPNEGNTAAGVLTHRMCPNNDGLSFLNDARIRVIVRDVNGVGIAGISAADVCILFNGGTAAQGFFGVGSDSIVANSGPITNGLGSNVCPDVRCVQADAPTDASGSTYIVFGGGNGLVAGVPTPGKRLRDPNRKWGHFDTDTPVYVLGFKLPGRETSAQVTASPAYVLRIKNLDTFGGTGSPAGGPPNGPGSGELVGANDISSVVAAQSPLSTNPFKWWMDVDRNGLINGADVTNFTLHFGHDCDTPAP